MYFKSAGRDSLSASLPDSYHAWFCVIAFHPGESVVAKSSVDLHFWRVGVQVFFQRVHTILVLATHVTQPVCFALATLRAKGALELRFFAALPMHMALQRVLPHVWTTASGTSELTGRFLADIIAGLGYLQLGEWYHRLFLSLPSLHG